MTKDEIRGILSLPFWKMIETADGVRRKGTGDRIDLCGIMNAKSGRCAENCRFCAQSSHYPTGTEVYPLKSTEEIVEAAKKARHDGAGRFGIVTSGNMLTKDEIGRIAQAIREITKTVDISLCASLGALEKEDFLALKEAGLTRYHHNIETSERYYPKVVTTHDFSERVKTIKNAKAAGLEVCSGGIIGMGETWDDRIDMAFTLKELGVDSVPLNVLVPIKGTPFEQMPTISPIDAVKTVAIFRIILGGATIKIAAGRETVLKDSQLLLYMAGANGMMIGGYLTVRGRPVEEDLKLVEEIKYLWKKS